MGIADRHYLETKREGQDEFDSAPKTLVEYGADAQSDRRGSIYPSAWRWARDRGASSSPRLWWPEWNAAVLRLLGFWDRKDELVTLGYGFSCFSQPSEDHIDLDGCLQEVLDDWGKIPNEDANRK